MSIGCGRDTQWRKEVLARWSIKSWMHRKPHQRMLGENKIYLWPQSDAMVLGGEYLLCFQVFGNYQRIQLHKQVSPIGFLHSPKSLLLKLKPITSRPNVSCVPPGVLFYRFYFHHHASVYAYGSPPGQKVAKPCLSRASSDSILT